LQILPSLSPFLKWIQLAVAVGVVYAAQYPDGPITIAAERTRLYSALFRPLPRPEQDAGAQAPQPEPAHG
jgi:hypothetical protein